MNKSDLEIAQESKAIHIKEVAKNIDLDDQYLECYGNDKAKISLDYLNNSDKKDGKLILVTAINPTRAGEGKSTTTVGLGDALNSIGKKTVIALREPSQGPVFGLKGGAAGGGYAQVIPMEDLNLHFTGDMHAITSANNLISACLDNYIYQGNELNIDINSIVWKRALDMNDRVLRNITIGQGSKFNGLERQDGFYITVASEIMAVLCLCNSMADLRQRIRKMIIAYTVDKRPVTVGDLNIHGAVCVILKDAIKPNLVQTLENNPVIIHGGPFANIAHGCNSILATKTALKLGDYVVTEAGFGADLGAEKFLNIKARVGKLKPDAVVIVATIRALKLNGEVEYEDLDKENINAMLGGCANLEKHVRNIKKFNLPFVICINKFITDTDNEVEALIEWAKVRDYDIELSEVWEHGSNGGKSLAKKIVELCEEENNFKHLYDLTGTIEEKINTISKEIYGAKSVVFSELALEQIKTFKKNGWDRLAICMAKTPISLSDDPKLLGCPKNFDIHVKEIKISNGAGFIVVLTGNIMTMPGLPQHPAAYDLDIDMDGKILGNF